MYIVRVPPRPPTPEEQARAFWDGLQKLSLILSVLIAIRQLNE